MKKLFTKKKIHVYTQQLSGLTKSWLKSGNLPSKSVLNQQQGNDRMDKCVSGIDIILKLELCLYPWIRGHDLKRSRS